MKTHNPSTDRESHLIGNSVCVISNQSCDAPVIHQVSDEMRQSKEESELRAALAASLANVQSSLAAEYGEPASSAAEPPLTEEDDELQAAIRLSLQDNSPPDTGTDTPSPQVNENGKIPLHRCSTHL